MTNRPSYRIFPTVDKGNIVPQWRNLWLSRNNRSVLFKPIRCKPLDILLKGKFSAFI